MYLSRYIKDCKDYMKKYPLENGNNKRIYYRNVLYINSQPKYLLGRLIDKLINIYDKAYKKFGREVYKEEVKV